MIGRSGLFADIMCPYDEDCTRPHCHFWHSKGVVTTSKSPIYLSSNDASQQQQSSISLISTTSAEQPFVGYVGYVENQKTANKTSMPIYSQSIYAPLDPVVYTQQPSTSVIQHNTSQSIPGIR
uniref:Uncharacterized protein n=1 Tax=Setaria digitata TaxID=48799 RepID=A0A915PN33_9BILA